MGRAEFARKGVEIAKKGIFMERPHNSHPREFARNVHSLQIQQGMDIVLIYKE